MTTINILAIGLYVLNGICSQYDFVMVSVELVIGSNLIASRSCKTCKMLQSCRTEKLEFEFCVLSKTCISCKVVAFGGICL